MAKISPLTSYFANHLSQSGGHAALLLQWINRPNNQQVGHSTLPALAWMLPPIFRLTLQTSQSPAEAWQVGRGVSELLFRSEAQIFCRAFWKAWKIFILEEGSNYIFICSGFSVISSTVQKLAQLKSNFGSNLLWSCYWLIMVVIGVNSLVSV